MAFWDKVKKVAGTVANEAVNSAQNYANEGREARDRWYDRYSNWDDERLKNEIRKYKNHELHGSGASDYGRIEALKMVAQDRGIIH